MWGIRTHGAGSIWNRHGALSYEESGTWADNQIGEQDNILKLDY